MTNIGNQTGKNEATMDATQPTPYEKLGIEIGKLVGEKQAAYGDSFGRSGAVMRALYPNGISPEQMDDALAIVRIVDKLFRIATRKDAFGESPYKDLVGYSLLGAARHEREREQVEADPYLRCETCGMKVRRSALQHLPEGRHIGTDRSQCNGPWWLDADLTAHEAKKAVETSSVPVASGWACGRCGRVHSLSVAACACSD